MLDPEERAFELGSFDLICSSNCLHAAPTLGHTLKNPRRLLRPDSRLFLMELSSVLTSLPDVPSSSSSTSRCRYSGSRIW
jgi:hypothetical protein